MSEKTDLQETPECSIPEEGGTASPSLRSPYAASASAERLFPHLEEICVMPSITLAQAEQPEK